MLEARRTIWKFYRLEHLVREIRDVEWLAWILILVRSLRLACSAGSRHCDGKDSSRLWSRQVAARAQ